ncbi:ATP-binding protein [Gibbsiella quercinecans]|uniref:type I secretion system permease/ATPase n=1 Tax=Gibbsiella quercinecans TaxID=929813 RepID=UPI000EF214CD|nr:type I secretion system permease/ATPase [Gibbsiella quercinecans]RLM02591.1 ATP-binding protein [Gibbsiella quercinecans]
MGAANKGGQECSSNREHLSLYHEAILSVANYYRLDYSSENVKLAAEWYQQQDKEANLRDVITLMARKTGMRSRYIPRSQVRFSAWSLPVVIELKDGRVGIMTNVSPEGGTIQFSGQYGMPTLLSRADIEQNLQHAFIFRPLVNTPDPRVDTYIKPAERHWIWRLLMRDRSPYKYIILASFLINVLGLAGITYSMQTYDRIIPAQSYPTMVVLFTGVVIAFIMDYVLKMLRYRIIDILGKQADLRISDRVFGHSLRIKNSHRPGSTGTFITQLRDLEQIREMMTSSTISAIADLPYFIFFLWVLYMMGGVIAVVPLAAFFIMVLPGILQQKKLYLLSNESMREASLRSGMMVEAIQGLDDIKSMQAEHRFQQQWNHYTRTSAESSLRLKHLTHQLASWAYLIQNGTFIGVICAGTPLVIAGELSTGALVACSILSSRMMGPVSQIASLITRWQQTKVAVKGIDGLMALPVDQPEKEKRIHKNGIEGHFVLENVDFRYRAESRVSALHIDRLQILPGEKIAVLGRNGAGKSALLNALYGNMAYSSGSVKIDGTELSLIDPADIRRDIVCLSQNARLFYGSLRENIVMGNPGASEEDVIRVLNITGSTEFTSRLPEGLNYIIQEGGNGLSGGQKQSILLCRMMLREPAVLLLDEPTANLDEITESELIDQLKTFTATRTLIVSTHRMKVLELVERIIVIDGGKIVLDEPKDKALRILSGAEQ